MSQTRVTYKQVTDARDEAETAQRAFMAAWLNTPGGTYENTQHLRDERDALERIFWELLDRFREQYDMDAKYEVRYSSNLPEYKPRGGVVCVETGMSLFSALDRRDADSPHPRDPAAHRQVYNQATGERVT